LAKKSRVWDGTAWQELASAQTDLTAYSTTAQMNTAITAGVGLVPILTQTIGTAVSSVTVTNAFSATYDAYKIIVTGGASSTENTITMILGATTANYFWFSQGLQYSGGGASNVTGSGSSWGTIGIGQTIGIHIDMDIASPFLAKKTSMRAARIGSNDGGNTMGYLNNSTSYTDFTITTSGGTLTGGTIRVYGYKN
jgi:hypothetical protein